MMLGLFHRQLLFCRMPKKNGQKFRFNSVVFKDSSKLSCKQAPVDDIKYQENTIAEFSTQPPSSPNITRNEDSPRFIDIAS